MRTPLRSIAFGLVVSSLSLAGMTGTANANLPPVGGGGGTAACEQVQAGYAPVLVTGGPKEWIFYGNFRVRMCIHQYNGKIYASGQLKTPIDSDKYDRFTQGMRVYMQTCPYTDAVGIFHRAQALKDYNAFYSQYDIASNGGSGWYLFTQQYTAAVSNYAKAQVVVRFADGAVVPRSSAFAEAMAPTGLNGYGYYSSGCLNP